jgi:hypothetical protein
MKQKKTKGCVCGGNWVSEWFNEWVDGW